MKKQMLFDLSSLPKMILNVALIVMIGVLFGTTSYLLKTPKTDLPIVNPIIETQCEIDSDCELVYTGYSGCIPCNTLGEEYQCLSQEEKIKAREYQRKFNNSEDIDCAPCFQLFEIQHTCKCENGKCEKVKEGLVEEVIITTDKIEYEIGEEVKITINNDSDEEQGIEYPVYFIERFENNNWLSIRKVLCPCGVLCSISQGFFIKSKDKMELEWDQQESWCNNLESTHPETISAQSPIGKYRIKSVKIDFDNADNKQIIYSNEFTIKEKSALDARCGEKVEAVGPCEMVQIGYEFDPVTKKCFINNTTDGCSVESPFKNLEECQEVCEESECAGEGEMISIMPLPDPEAKIYLCCEGLKQGGAFSDDGDGKCYPIMDAAVCIDCPNGICGPGENKCNCPEDCE